MVQKYDCQEPGSAPEPTLGNRVWTTLYLLSYRNAAMGNLRKKITDDRARSSGYACSRTDKQARSVVAYRNTPLRCRDRSNNVSLNRCRPRRNTSSCRMSEAFASALTQARALGRSMLLDRRRRIAESVQILLHLTTHAVSSLSGPCRAAVRVF